jgi:DNA-binding NarL/FixJ family response regulator
VDEALELVDELVRVLTVVWQNEWFLARIRLNAQVLGVLAAAAPTASQVGRAELIEHGRRLMAEAYESLNIGMPAGRKMGHEGIAWQARLEAEWARLRWLCDIDPPEESEHIAAWQSAVDSFDYGNTFEQARSRAGLAAVLRAAGQTKEALDQARLAADVARQLGATPLLAEVGGSAAPASSSRSQAHPDALTGREREVLALLVEGRTNRQIGRQLYISEKTVSVHVSNILAKLQLGSRTEAAAMARRDGLLA